MTDRALTSAPLTAATQDIRDHEYAIVQTRAERVPDRFRTPKCTDPDGCQRPATLVTVALAKVNDEGEDAVGLRLARYSNGGIAYIPSCDEHRVGASHDLFFRLTGRMRPDGIRAFDFPGQHLTWT